MNSISREIFTAIHEGKWVSIEYENKDGQKTKYWIAIKDLNVHHKSLIVEGLHLSQFSLCNLTIYFDGIKSAKIIDGSYYPVNEKLIDDIKENAQKYSSFFKNVINLKVLNYLLDCNKMDCTPYKTEYSLLENFDEDCLKNGTYKLSDAQFKAIISDFQITARQRFSATNGIKQLCMNVLSVFTKKGLYVLAYKKLMLDVINRELIPSKETIICKEFTVDGEKQSIRFFLDADDCELVDEFDKNRELIKDKIAESNRYVSQVDDMPYLMALEYEVPIDLNYEYSAIVEMVENNTATAPIKAFFGDLTSRPSRRKEFPIALLNQKVNLDQLLAINNAMKFPVSYVQGPPGTGKTNTILNAISTAFFNDKTVLFSSYNNHPIDAVFNYLKSMTYRGNTIPFPIIRLGNVEKIKEAIDYIKGLINQVKQITIYESTLERNKDERIEKSKQLSKLLKEYEETLDLKERRETINKILDSSNDFNLTIDLQSRQLHAIDQKIEEYGEINDDDALSLLSNDHEEYMKYLYYTSARYIKKLNEPKYDELKDILALSNSDEQVKEFNKYLSDEENLEKFIKVFPIVVTTCISAHKLGSPKQYFDITILDEASQCNTAISLVPIIRGENLLLVGDPQQLNPVILLDSKVNTLLREKYSIPDEYDYINNSIYKTFLACDAVSDEVLLRYHYRCNKKIIEFNNKKYYNSKLCIRSANDEPKPLVYVNVENSTTDYKNTAPEEAEQIAKFAMLNRDKSVGVITPFVNQKRLINDELKNVGITNVECGTVHAFQGDEKDIILFSLALTDKTMCSTYQWLKNNKELINVAVSRAKNKLIIVSSDKDLERLHAMSPEDDDIYELAEYVKQNGESKVTSRSVNSRALGIKPYSTETEDAFLTSLNQAIGNINTGRKQYEVKKEVAISQVFQDNFSDTNLFYSGRFDFVVYDKVSRLPVFAIELDGKEHFDDETVKKRDEKKNQICSEHHFQLIRVDNSYARRYAHIKGILMNYFDKM